MFTQLVLPGNKIIIYGQLQQFRQLVFVSQCLNCLSGSSERYREEATIDKEEEDGDDAAAWQLKIIA